VKYSYPKITDGEWVRPKQEGYRLACCDCGLIHAVNFRIVDGHIEFQPTRHARATAQRRRALKKSK
jgi:hypothetical protein